MHKTFTSFKPVRNQSIKLNHIESKNMTTASNKSFNNKGENLKLSMHLLTETNENINFKKISPPHFPEVKNKKSSNSLRLFQGQGLHHNQNAGQMNKLKTSINLKFENNSMKKDLEILNLTSINEQLIKAQEQKHDIILEYSKENFNLKKEVGSLHGKLEGMKNRMRKMMTMITHYKNVIREFGKNVPTEEDLITEDEEEEDNIKIKHENKEKHKNTQNFTGSGLSSGPSSGKNSKLAFKKQKTVDHYKSLTLNHMPLGNNENLSLQLYINGQKSLFKYNSEMVAKILTSKQFLFIEKILLSCDIFKENLNTNETPKLDEMYFTIKGIINDYKSTLTLFSKINKLLEIQNVFCQRVIMGDIFEKICEIVTQTLECDRATLYLVDNRKKELWSKAAKASTIIRLPFGIGLAGFVAENKSNLVLDDAYFNPRFNKEYDLKTGYRTKSVLCVPVLDPESKEVIGVIQSINKKVKPFVFDVNDEITSELLSQMIGMYLKQSIGISDHNTHENKLKKLLHSATDIISSDSLEEVLEKSRKLVMNLFTADKVQIFVNLREFPKFNKKFNYSNEMYRCTDDIFCEVSESNMKLGIVGNCLEKMELVYVPSTFNSRLYNPNVDIDTSLPVVTLPVLNHVDFKLIAVLQFEYNVTKLGISDFRVNHIDQMDYDILSLFLRLLTLNLNKILYRV